MECPAGQEARLRSGINRGVLQAVPLRDDARLRPPDRSRLFRAGRWSACPGCPKIETASRGQCLLRVMLGGNLRMLANSLTWSKEDEINYNAPETLGSLDTDRSVARSIERLRYQEDVPFLGTDAGVAEIPSWPPTGQGGRSPAPDRP